MEKSNLPSKVALSQSHIKYLRVEGVQCRIFRVFDEVALKLDSVRQDKLSFFGTLEGVQAHAIPVDIEVVQVAYPLDFDRLL